MLDQFWYIWYLISIRILILYQIFHALIRVLILYQILMLDQFWYIWCFNQNSDTISDISCFDMCSDIISDISERKKILVRIEPTTLWSRVQCFIHYANAAVVTACKFSIRILLLKVKRILCPRPWLRPLRLALISYTPAVLCVSKLRYTCVWNCFIGIKAKFL